MAHTALVFAPNFRSFGTEQKKILEALHKDQSSTVPCFLKIGQQDLHLVDDDGVSQSFKMLQFARVYLKEWRIFLDYKIGDIKTTTHDTLVRLFEKGGIHMATCNARSSKAALQQFAQLCDEHDAAAIAYTIPTDISDAEYRAREERSLIDDVVRLARYARTCNMHGVTCSGKELPALDKNGWMKAGMLTVVPGIRFRDEPDRGQVRMVSPRVAAGLGATHAVVGSPIFRASDPMSAMLRYKEALAAE
jgi:orotidine-5'-phosphate decarboxylase